MRLVAGTLLAALAAPLLAAEVAPTTRYLGQALPGRSPALFAPGIVNTGMYTRDMTVSPDGTEMYWSVVIGGNKLVVIVGSRLVAGRWTAPEVVPQLGLPGTSSIEPCISPDGKRFYFSSNRQAPGKKADPHDYDIWVMERQAGGWGAPANLGAPVNTTGGEYFPSVTKDGTLYFTAPEPAGGGELIWRARPAETGFAKPEKLPPQVNAGQARFNAFVAADESYLIVPTYGMPDSRGATDYYVTFRRPDDTWTDPVNLGDAVNTSDGNEYSASVSPDGKVLFFMSGRMPALADMPTPLTLTYLQKLRSAAPNGDPAVYWVDARVIEEAKAKLPAK